MGGGSVVPLAALVVVVSGLERTDPAVLWSQLEVADRRVAEARAEAAAIRAAISEHQNDIVHFTNKLPLELPADHHKSLPGAVRGGARK